MRAEVCDEHRRDHASVAPTPKPGIAVAASSSWAMPLLLITLCFANYFTSSQIPPGPRVVIIFVLLISMMTTGMPISIALGLTVLISSSP